MVDGTPVLDIKPYIPQYDNPLHCESPMSRLLDGREAEVESTSAQTSQQDSRLGEREAPDGEEGARPSAVPPLGMQNERSSNAQVRIPSWIAQVSKLKVTFSDRAKAQLENLERDSETENPEHSIRSVLQEDPRSVYLHERWGSQFYTFLICNLHVSCKFDDSVRAVTVLLSLRENFANVANLSGSAAFMELRHEES
ncbi:hypothetical protein C0J52_21523 [Blattella germanica]|nr:hypothetical protein C0J52_21523 [Blattella germanica]